MANQNFWFPSQAGSYSLPNGDNLQIQIFYDDGTAASNTDTDGHILKLHDLKLPLEVDPANQGFRFASMAITFTNDIYDATNNIFEQYDILNETYSLDTYIIININGSEFWRGMIQYDKTLRADYYLDGSTLKYRKIKITCYDLLYYFKTHDVDLTDVSYSAPIVLKTFLGQICTELGLGATDYDLDSNLKITEDSGGSYEIWDMSFGEQTAGDQVIDWLKEFAVATGTFIYTLNGKIVFTFRGNVGTALALDSDHIVNMVRKENYNKIEYVKYESDLAYNVNKMPTSFTGLTFTHLKEAGTLSQITAKNWQVDAKAIISTLYTIATEADWGSLPTTFATATDTQASYTGADFETDGIESGDVFSVEYSSGVYGDHASYNDHTMVFNLPAANTIEYHDVGAAPANSIGLLTEAYNDRRYKVHLLHALIGDGYEDYYLTSPDILAVRIAGISTYKDFQRQFTRDGSAYKIKSAKFFIVEDEVYMELMKVA
jgi:hypothetical protein